MDSADPGRGSAESVYQNATVRLRGSRRAAQSALLRSVLVACRGPHTGTRGSTLKRIALATSAVAAMIVGLLGVAAPATAVEEQQIGAGAYEDCSLEQPGFVVTSTNWGPETTRISIDIDRDLDGIPDFGDGPPVDPGQTLTLPYGVEDGQYGVRISTDRGVLFDEVITVWCALRPIDILPQLTVAAENTTREYNRDMFPHWIDADNDGCDTRDEVLIEESTTTVTVGSGCAISNGTWLSAYDNQTWTATSDVDIDHMVPLAEAWRSGAWRWNEEQRTAFANDLDVEYALLAVTDNVNQSKGDRDPASWMPPATDYACEYATSWLLVKYRWSLTIDTDEHNALDSVFSGDCGTREVTIPNRAAVSPPPAPISFTDVSGHTFQTQIAWLADQGVTRGWSVGPNTYEFRPQQRILRAEMAAFLYRLAGEPAYTPPATSRFIDVSTSHTFYKEINWLAESGISIGWSTPRGAEFRPQQPTSREVMAAFLHRYVGSPAYNAAESPFRDVSSSAIFYKEILWLASEGISTGWDVGYGCREYRPSQNVLRAEMAAFLYRMENGGTPPITTNECSPPQPDPSPMYSGTVSAGAFCARANSGWYGYTSNGTLMQCTTSATDTRLRWRAA
ncbi:S-layer homology domain-containing protein [Microbacterium aquimaris]|uniref:S-layer homology domain-containing protein n=1 Tax=Microbacterium aquimaris TaxID=459816 RepID=UPI002AD54D12|nr:S-layer homology domain-containing protein [Microbacterium aquimaris]MDZ8275662.1 S-layer homology domain-containing protein [Microbacterium aquimaris]